MGFLGKVVGGISRLTGNSSLERSKDYRKNYLKKHKGFFGIYTCAYCGCLVPKGVMEVDHIFPVHKAKEELLGMAYVLLASSLFLHAKEGVNGVWNTCSACHYCNHLKSAKGGLWVVRGYLGRIIFPILNFVMAFNIVMGGLELLKGDPSGFLTWLIALGVYRFVAWFLFKREALR